MISGEPRTRRKAAKSMRIRDDTHRNLQIAKDCLEFKTWDQVIFYLTERFLSEWTSVEFDVLMYPTKQSVLQQANVVPKKLD